MMLLLAVGQLNPVVADTVRRNINDSKTPTTITLAKSSDAVTYGSTYKLLAEVTEGYDGTFAYNLSNSNIASLEATEGGFNVTPLAVGTTTITFSAAETDNYLAASDEVFTLTVEDNTVAPGEETVFSETFDGCKGSKIITSGNYRLDNTGWAYSTVYESNKFVQIGKSDTKGSLTTPPLSFTTTASLTFRAGGYNSDERTIILTGNNCTIDGETSVTLSDLRDSQFRTYGPYTLTKTGDNPTVQFSTSSSSRRVYLDDVVVTVAISTVPATIAQNREWATFCSPYVLDFTNAVDGLKGAYYVSGSTENTVTLTKVTGKVNPGTGLLLRATSVDTENATTINIPVSAEGSPLGGNKLVGTISPRYIEATSGGNTNYGLQNGEFHPYAAAGTLGANKAYLQLPTKSARTLTFVVEDETNGIANVHQTSATDNDACYDLQGRRVNLQQKKGLYIRNGKKVLVK